MRTFKATRVYYKDGWHLGQDIAINMDSVVTFSPDNGFTGLMPVKAEGKQIYIVETTVHSTACPLKVVSDFLDKQWEETT